MKKSQKEKILAYMKEHGSITPLDALEAFGCFRLSGRIYELRHEGHNIVAYDACAKNEDGEVKHYAIYRLEEDA